MHHRFGTFVLLVTTLFFLFTALSSGFAPEKFAERLGLVIATAGGFNEIRAQYGGFFLAATAVCAASLFGVVSRQTAFILMLVVFGGLIGGRLVSLALNEGFAGFGPTILALYAIDAIGFTLAITAFALDRQVRT